MPGNTIVINKSEELQWYVGDSKMDLLIALLNEIGHKGKGPYKEPETCPNCESPFYPWKMTKVCDGFCPDCGKKLGLHTTEPVKKHLTWNSVGKLEIIIIEGT